FLSINSCLLSQFQRSYTKQYKQHRHDPEPRYNLRFMISFLLVMVVQGTHQKNPSAHTIFLFSVFEIGYLYHHAQVLDQEYATENRYQQFLVHDDGDSGNDSSQGQASRIAHEYLGGIGIVPKESHTGPDHGGQEYG